VNPAGLSKALVKRWQQAEAVIAQSTTDPRFNWQADTLETQFKKAGLTAQIS
jgi:putative ATPase